jgi:hypothetical protein
MSPLPVTLLVNPSQGKVVVSKTKVGSHSLTSSLHILLHYFPLLVMHAPSDVSLATCARQDGHRRALFSMMSVEEAHRLVRERNFAFIGNHRVHLRVLQ